MRSASQSGHWSHEGSARLSCPHHISIALFRTQLYKAAQLRSLGGCLPSLGPSSNLVEADHMQVQRATERGAYCNVPRSIQHGAVHTATTQLQWAAPHTYWAPITAIGCAAVKSRTFTNQNRNRKADPNMRSAHSSRNGSKMNQVERVDIVDMLTCRVVDMLDLVDRVVDSLDVVDIADIMDLAVAVALQIPEPISYHQVVARWQTMTWGLDTWPTRFKNIFLSSSFSAQQLTRPCKRNAVNLELLTKNIAARAITILPLQQVIIELLQSQQ